MEWELISALRDGPRTTRELLCELCIPRKSFHRAVNRLMKEGRVVRLPFWTGLSPLPEHGLKAVRRSGYISSRESTSSLSLRSLSRLPVGA